MKRSMIKKSTAFVLATLLLLINIAVFLLPDVALSDRAQIKVSAKSREFLSGLDSDVEISVIRGSTHDTVFESFMKEYASCSDKITLRFLELSEASEMLSDVGYSASGENASYAVIVKSDKRAKLLDYSSLFYYENPQFGRLTQSGYMQYYQLFTSSESYLAYLDSLIYDSEYYFYGDALITGLVEYVSIDVIPRAYMLASHGVDSVTDGNFSKLLLSMGYEYGELDMGEGASVPEDAGCVIINEPKEDITEGELNAILDYLAAGGRLLLVTDENAADMPNLMTLTASYGMSTDKKKVATSTEGIESFMHTPILNTDHDITSALSGYKPSIVNANPIKISDALRPSQLVTPLVSTPNTAYIEGDTEKGVHHLGVAAEEEVTAGTTRLVWFTGADSFNGDIKSADSLALLVYSVAWLNKTYSSKVTDIPAVAYGDSVMRVPDNAFSIGVSVILISVAAIIVSGVVVISRRKKK